MKFRVRRSGKSNLWEEMKNQRTTSASELKRIEIEMSSLYEEKSFLEEMLQKQHHEFAEVEELMSSLMSCRSECESAEREMHRVREQLDFAAMSRETITSQLGNISQEHDQLQQQLKRAMAQVMVLEEQVDAEYQRLRPIILRHNYELAAVKEHLDQVATLRSGTPHRSEDDETSVKKLYHRLEEVTSLIPHKYQELKDVEVVTEQLGQFSLNLDPADDRILEKLGHRLDEIEDSLKRDKHLFEMQVVRNEMMQMRESTQSLQSHRSDLIRHTQSLQEEMILLEKSHLMAMHTFEKQSSMLEDSALRLYTLISRKGSGMPLCSLICAPSPPLSSSCLRSYQFILPLPKRDLGHLGRPEHLCSQWPHLAPHSVQHSSGRYSPRCGEFDEVSDGIVGACELEWRVSLQRRDSVSFHFLLFTSDREDETSRSIVLWVLENSDPHDCLQPSRTSRDSRDYRHEKLHRHSVAISSSPRQWHLYRDCVSRVGKYLGRPKQGIDVL
jgi:chromosome segregation ATPase